MKLHLEVFSNNNDIRNSTLRGLIAFTFLILINVVYIYFIIDLNIKPTRRFNAFLTAIVSYIVGLILISCAISIQHPNTLEDDDDDIVPSSRAVIYGLMLGFIVYGFANSMAYRFIKGWTIGILMRNVGFGIVSVSLTALVTYYCADSSNLY